jgi:hypothetical protein
MSAFTVSEIQNRIATLVDQSASAPDSSTDEFAWRTKLLDRSYQEWAYAYDWEALRKEVFISDVSGTPTISLPADFRKMAMQPILYNNSAVPEGQGWPEIKPEDRRMYLSTDNYFYLLGSRGSYNMIWSPNTLASGASLLVSYFSFPTILSTASQTVAVPDPEFLVQRTVAYIYEVRNDARFQEVETKARECLLQLIDNENNRGFSNNDDVITPERRMDFRIGRDG